MILYTSFLLLSIALNSQYIPTMSDVAIDEIPKSSMREKAPRKKREPRVPLPAFYDKDKYQFEIGIDEAGRGPMFGRLYIAGVVLPKDGSMDTTELRDSKKISKKHLPQFYHYITQNALAYHVTYIEAAEIDEINIREAVVKGMHKCAFEIIEQLKEKQLSTAPPSTVSNPEPYFLMVDGNDFPPYYHDGNRISYQTFLQGDNTYANIAAASILAKVSRDNYILELCKRYPLLSQQYEMHQHMGYGTKKHLDAIRTYGITQFHRKTFGLCKTATLKYLA